MQQVLVRVCRRSALGAAVLVLSLIGGGPAAAGTSDVPTASPLATLGDHRADLTRVDPLSLRPEGPRVPVASEWKGVYSFAPDGSAAAFGRTIASPPVRGHGIRVVDIQDLSVIADVPTDVYGAALAWLEPRRLVALIGVGTINGSVAYPGHQFAVVVDPFTGEELERVLLPVGDDDEAFHCAAAEARGEALLVLFDRRLFVIGADGDFETVRLPREFSRCGDVAASPGGESAFAVSAGGDVVIEIALPSAESEVHRLGGSTRGTLQAIALDRRRLVIARRGPNDQPRGVSIVDVDRERRESIDPSAGDARVVDDTILAFGGAGVRGYDRSGKREFEVLGDRRPTSIEPAGGFAYALISGSFAIVDVDAGTVVHRSSSRTRLRPGSLLQRQGSLTTEAEE